ncbi:MAG: hypothetical protein HYV07_21595 [Deltaproteobacteria bacterium]|nr:hypothetical protein [Deltaproteobacteria bacterium]
MTTTARDFVLRLASIRAKQRAARVRLEKAEWLLRDGSPFAADPIEVDAAEEDRLEALASLAEAAEKMSEVEAGLADADLAALPAELRDELDRLTSPGARRAAGGAP